MRQTGLCWTLLDVLVCKAKAFLDEDSGPSPGAERDTSSTSLILAAAERERTSQSQRNVAIKTQ